MPLVLITFLPFPSKQQLETSGSFNYTEVSVLKCVVLVCFVNSHLKENN